LKQDKDRLMAQLESMAESNEVERMNIEKTLEAVTAKNSKLLAMVEKGKLTDSERAQLSKELEENNKTLAAQLQLARDKKPETVVETKIKIKKDKIPFQYLKQHKIFIQPVKEDKIKSIDPSSEVKLLSRKINTLLNK